MDLDEATAEMASRRTPRPQSTLGEIWSAELTRGGLTTLGGSGKPFEDAYEDLRGRVEQAYNRPIGDLMKESNLSMHGADNLVRSLGVLVDRFPDEEKRKELEPFKDVRLRAMQKAAKIERDADEIGGATYGFSGWVTGMAAGLAANFLDPATMAVTLPFGVVGGAARMGAAQFIIREAIANAAAQAAIEPAIQARRGELGLESGFTEGAINVLQAGIGGAGVAGLIKGGGYALRRFGVIRPRAEAPAPVVPVSEDVTAPAPAPAVQAELDLGPVATSKAQNLRRVAGEVNPEDFEAVGNYVETRQVIVENTAPPGLRNLELHERRIDEGAAALEEARAPRPIETPSGTPANPLPFAEKFAPQRVVAIEEPQLLIRPNGERMVVHPMVLELNDLTVSHTGQGAVNPDYPAQLQPRERTGAASQTFIAQKAAALEPELLGRSPTAATGAPVIGPDGVVESGNGRVLLLERAYELHPERATAYRQFLERQGYDLEGFERPVLVRMREGDLPIEVRGRLAVEANVSEVAGLAPRERAFVDAKLLDRALLASYVPGDVQSAANRDFVREFANRAVAPTERPNFIDGNNQLSAEGARRIEAALVAKAWNAPDIVSALYEAVDPSSRAILGAFADVAPKVAQLKAAIEEGRLGAELDPTGAMLEALRFVERARQQKFRIAEAIYQVDIETGAVPDEVREAVKLFFRDPETLRRPAGRDAVAAAIDKVVSRGLNVENSVGDLFGVKVDALGAIREGVLTGSLEIQELYGAGEIGLRRMVELKYEAAVIAEHPTVKGTMEQALALPRSTELPGYGTPEFKGNREFDFRELGGEARVVGYEEAYKRLEANAKKYGGGDTANEGVAVVMIGMPASGKSTYAEAVARAYRAAIVDSDDAKKVIPEFRGGIGGGSVHSESIALMLEVQRRLQRDRTNMVFPTVGGQIERVNGLLATLRESGYENVVLVNVAVEEDEAFRRMVSRMLKTKRVIELDYFRSVDSKPDQNYLTLKAEGTFNEYVSIDNNAPPGQHRILDGADTEMARRGIGGGPDQGRQAGGGGSEGARGLQAGRAEERGAAPGAEVAGAPEPGRTVEAARGTQARVIDESNAAEAARILEREGDLQDLHIIDPDTGEVRAVNSARAELANAQAQVDAAGELAGCLGGMAA